MELIHPFGANILTIRKYLRVMQIDIFTIIRNQCLILSNEMNKTKKELLSLFNKMNCQYKIEVIDEDCKRECIFICLANKTVVQFLLYNDKVSNIMIEVYGGYYFYNNKKIKNSGIDSFITLANKDNFVWGIESCSEKEIIVKIKNILFYFDYDLKYPLYKIQNI